LRFIKKPLIKKAGGFGRTIKSAAKAKAAIGFQA